MFNLSWKSRQKQSPVVQKANASVCTEIQSRYQRQPEEKASKFTKNTSCPDDPHSLSSKCAFLTRRRKAGLKFSEDTIKYNTGGRHDVSASVNIRFTLSTGPRLSPRKQSPTGEGRRLSAEAGGRVSTKDKHFTCSDFTVATI